MGASDSVVEADPAEQVVSYRDQKHYRRHLWQPPHGELTEPAQAHLGVGPLSDGASLPVNFFRCFAFHALAPGDYLKAIPLPRCIAFLLRFVSGQAHGRVDGNVAALEVSDISPRGKATVHQV